MGPISCPETSVRNYRYCCVITKKSEVHSSFTCRQNPDISPTLSQMDPLHTLPICFFKIHFYVILPSKPRSSKSPCPSGPPTLATIHLSFSHNFHINSHPSPSSNLITHFHFTTTTNTATINKSTTTAAINKSTANTTTTAAINKSTATTITATKYVNTLTTTTAMTTTNNKWKVRIMWLAISQIQTALPFSPSF